LGIDPGFPLFCGLVDLNQTPQVCCGCSGTEESSNPSPLNKRRAFNNLNKNMEISIFFARFLGGFFVIFGLLFIITKQLGKTIEMTENKEFVISTGYISLLMGLATVVLHNLWVADWRVVITILGWSTLIKGILKIGFPEFIHKQAQKFKTQQTLEAIALLLLGGWLFWASF